MHPPENLVCEIWLSLPDWPRDIFLVFLENCSLGVLALLTRTCKTFKAYCTPLLYKIVDLTDPDAREDNNNRNALATIAHQEPKTDWCKVQLNCIDHLLSNPSLVRNVRNISFSLGLFCNRHPDEKLFKMFNSLRQVKYVDLHTDDGISTYPILDQGLRSWCFPNAKHITLRGHMTYYMVRRILFGTKNTVVETVYLALRLHDLPYWHNGDEERSFTAIAESLGRFPSLKRRPMECSNHKGELVASFYT